MQGCVDRRRGVKGVLRDGRKGGWGKKGQAYLAI